jgi:hypothetical protein
MGRGTGKRHPARSSSRLAAPTHATSPLRSNARGNRQQRDCEQPG